MTTSRTRALLTLGLVLAAAGAQFAAELGQPASPLKPETWVKGKAIDLAEGKGKTVYVVEFWATWHGPCRAAIPHLTELQKRFAAQGVVFIGISDEPADKVKPFVEQMGDKMGYRVAVDTTRATHEAYLDAFGARGIPHAFVVDKNGNIAWHGHSMVGLDRTLEEILAGKFDLEAAKRSLHAEDLVPQYFAGASADRPEPRNKELGDQIVTGAARNPAFLNEFAWMILTDQRVKSRDLGLALRAAKLAYDDTAGNDSAIVDTYARAMFDNGRKAEAIKLQKEAIAVCKDERTRLQLQATLKEYEGARSR